MSGPGVRVGRAAGAVLATAVAGLGLVLSGSVLPAPPLFHPGLWSHWWTGAGPVLAVFALTRIFLVTALACWTALLAAATTVALQRGARRLATEALESGWPARRAVVRLALALSTSGVLAAACGQPGGRASPAPPAPVLWAGAAAPLGGPDAAVTAPAKPASAPAAKGVPAARAAPAGNRAPGVPGTGRQTGPSQGLVAELHPTPASTAAAAQTAAAQTAPAQTAPAQTAPARTAAASRSPGAPVPGGTWVVRPGDDLWSIAAAALAGRPGTDQQAAQTVAPYWLAVIEANRSRLPDPADPSLLYAGDVLILPPV